MCSGWASPKSPSTACFLWLFLLLFVVVWVCQEADTKIELDCQRLAGSRGREEVGQSEENLQTSLMSVARGKAICMEIQKTSNSQSYLEKEEWNWRNQPTWLQALLQSHSYQDSMVLAPRLKEIKHTLYLLRIYYVTNTDVKGWKHNCKQHQQDLWSYKQIRKHKQISKIISEGAKRCFKKKKRATW